MCPNFNAIIAGNDWTKQLFGEGKYEIVPVERNTSPDRKAISGTKVRNIIYDTI